MAELVKEYRALNGAINTGVTSELLKATEVRGLVNVDISEIGKLTKSNGTDLFADLSAVTESVSGPKFIFGTNRNDLIYAYSQDNLMWNYDGTWANIHTDPLNVSKGYVWLLDTLFMVDEDDGSIHSYNLDVDEFLDGRHLINVPTDVDAIGQVNGKMYVASGNKIYESSAPRQIVTTVIDTHVAGSTTIHVDSTRYLQAGNTVEVHPADNDTARESVQVVAVTSDTTFTCTAITNQFENGDELFYENLYGIDTIMWDTDTVKGNFFLSDDNCVALQGHKGTMLVFSDNGSIERYSGSRNDNISANTGTFVPLTITAIGDKVYFFETESDRLMVVDGNNVYEVGKKAKAYWDVATMSAAFSTGFGGKYRVYIGSVDIDDETYDHGQIIFDPSTDTFSFEDTIHVSAYGIFDSQLLLGDETSDNIHVIDKETHLLDDGTTELEMNYVIKTKHDDLDKPDIYKYFTKAWFYCEPGTILDVSYSIDRGEVKHLGQITQQVQSFEINDRGNTISYIISESSKGEVPGFKGFKTKAAYDDEE